MTITEHKLNLIRQIDKLPEQSLIELEKIIMQLKANHAIQPVKKHSLKMLLDSWSDLEEDFPDITDCPPVTNK
jgi:hypothetical protein